MDTNSRSGADNTYTLRQLFGENITIVIPDIQRDYCWGADGEAGKVTPFMMSLMKLYNTRRINSLGLLYGYENPAGSRHIHIIDGQQRITTLYLLVGMLYRRTPRKDLRRMLISDYELTDDREPRLLYEARAETMYFMSELVTHFFLNRDGRLSQLENSTWYCAAYSTDPTVQNFIRAVRKIDEAIERVCHEEGWDFDDFADFVIDRLIFFHHDIGERAAAEEMFVTINTTGEPLTVPQQIKGFLPDDSDILDKWEEMEQWAWQNRPEQSGELHALPDERLISLIRIWEKFTGKNKRDIPGNPHSLYTFFRSYRTLCQCQPELIEMKPESAADMFVILPSVKFIKRWNLSAADKDIIEDFTALLCNVARYQRLSPSGADTEAACKLVERMQSSDVLSLLDLSDNIAPKIVSDEELTKLRVIADNIADRRQVSGILRKGERHPLLCGKLQKVISWSTDRAAHKVDIRKLSRYIDLVYEIWGKTIDKRPELDALRRAMLTLRHEGYPMQRRADSTLSLCWHEYEWQRLMTLSPGAIRQLLDRVAENKRHPEEALRKMTGRFDDKTYPYFFLIASDNLISKCLHRSLLRYCDPFIGYYTEYSTGGASKPVMQWLIEGRPIKIDLTRWTAPRPYGTRCLYTDHRRLNVAVDIHFLPEQGKNYRIEVFSRGNNPQKEPFDLRILLNRTGRRFNFDKKNCKYYIIAGEPGGALGLLHTLLSGC